MPTDPDQPATMPDPLCECGHRASSHAHPDSGDTRCLAVEAREDLIAVFDDGRDGDYGYCACLRFTEARPTNPRTTPMTKPTPHTTILKAHLEGMPSHTIGDEIWHEALDDAIRWEAEATVEHMPARLLQLIGRDQALDLVVKEMTAALREIGDRYQAIDGVLYELLDGDPINQTDEASLDAMTGAPTVTEVTFEALPTGSSGSRRAIARWSDGTEDELLRWHSDELLFCEGDLIGKTREEIRALHFRRDRDWLQS